MSAIVYISIIVDEYNEKRMIMNLYKQNARIFKAFCDESRLRIIDLIRASDEVCACVLLEDLSISQSTLSHHMKILVESGLVSSRKDGKRTMYSLSKDCIKKSIGILEDMLSIDNIN